MNLLKLRNLHVTFKTEHKKVFAVRGVNFDLRKGEIVGIVGESGCGKSATAKALMRLIDVDDGQILFEDIDLAKLSEKQMQKVRGKRIGMIFQDPLSALNPTMKIGHQIIEAIRLHTNDSRTEAKQKAIDLLNQVGIPDAQLRYDQYPHELSGGMRQRVGIAIALSCDPQILIADEPTTALDVTIQAQILALLKELQHTRNMSIILITHDLSIVAGLCDRVIVMYAGEIVEEASTEALFETPKHPYTRRLLQSIPRADVKLTRLKAIKGHPPSLDKTNNYCSFCPRCKDALNICVLQQPPQFEVGDNHFAACWLYDKRKTNATTDRAEEAVEKIPSR